MADLGNQPDMSGLDQLLIASKSSDTVPNAFGFTDVAASAISTLNTSNVVTPTGYDTTTAWSVTNGALGSVNGGAYSASGTISVGQTLTLRATSSASNSTTTNYVVTIGGVTDNWSITTVAYVALPSQVAYTTAGTYSWVVPAGVTAISCVTVGGGGGGSATDGANTSAGGGGGGGLSYVNTLAVTPGETLTVVVGFGGPTATNFTLGNSGGDSSLARGGSVLCLAKGGTGGNRSSWASGGAASGGVGSGKFSGGNGGIPTTGSQTMHGNGAGGGAAGYAGNGGYGGYFNGSSINPSIGGDGAGGAGAGGYTYRAVDGSSTSGGGVGIFGQGASGLAYSWYSYTGTANAAGGSGGANANAGGNNGGSGGNYGAGAGAQAPYYASSGNYGGAGGVGAVRIIWPGNTRYFPSTRTGDE